MRIASVLPISRLFLSFYVSVFGALEQNRHYFLTASSHPSLYKCSMNSIAAENCDENLIEVKPQMVESK